MKKKKVGFVIGRFQPFHKGHEDLIAYASKKVKYLIIGIGSADQHHTIDNPFTAKERTDMINQTLENKLNYTIVPIPDINNYAKWVKHVEETVKQKVDIIFTGNKIVQELFEKEGYKVVKIKETRSYVSGAAIRDMISRDGPWEELVPKGVEKIIEETGGITRIKEIYNSRYKNPVPAVDVIIETNKGILLIERNHEPFGWAIPGGHIEYGESAETAAVREAKEETSLDVKLIRLLGVYSDPKRDPRKHTISMVYVAKSEGVPKADSDAKSFKIYTKDNLPENLCFDHKKILEDYFKTKEGTR